jgi:hypothetical protein
MLVNELVAGRHRKYREGNVKKNRDGRGDVMIAWIQID